MKIFLKTILTTALITLAMAPFPASANPGDLYATDNFSIRKYTPDGTPSIFASGLFRPRGLAFDRFGNLYVSTLDTAAFGDSLGRILKFAPDGTYTTFASGLHNPEQIVFDRAGNIFATSAGLNNSGSGDAALPVYKIARDGTVTTFVTIGNDGILHQFLGAALDIQGNLFVADDIANAVYLVTKAGKVSILASVNGASGLAFGDAASLYVSSYADGTVTKIAADGAQTTFASGLGDIRGLAFDAYGSLFVAGHNSGNIYEVSGDGTVSTFATGLVVAQFLAFDPIFPPPPPASRPAHPTPPPHPAVPATYLAAPGQP